jgi:hypothetical protein
MAAATRLANYWKMRKEIFQPSRAFLPINLTGHGAMTEEDVRVLQTGYFISLPLDQQGRSVLYADVSRKTPGLTPSARTIFFALQCVMENEASRHDYFSILFNISNPFAANFVMPVRVVFYFFGSCCCG